MSTTPSRERREERDAGWTRTRVEIGGAAPDDLGFVLHRLAAPADGPHVTVLAAIHGDEATGALAAGMLAASELPLARGTLTLVPVANEAAFEAVARESPIDGKNLARTFPGDAEGSATERLADALVRRAMTGIDCLIDLHTAGAAGEMPFLAGFGGDGTDLGERSRQLAHAFGAPVVWRHEGYSPGRSVAAATACGAAAIYVESAGGERVDPELVERYVAGVKRVLVALGMLVDPELPPAPRAVEVRGGGNLDRGGGGRPADGLFLACVRAGDDVAAGQRVGEIVDRGGTALQEVVAHEAGKVMYLRRRARVAAGDALLTVAEIVPA